MFTYSLLDCIDLLNLVDHNQNDPANIGSIQDWYCYSWHIYVMADICTIMLSKQQSVCWTYTVLSNPRGPFHQELLLKIQIWWKVGLL